MVFLTRQKIRNVMSLIFMDTAIVCSDLKSRVTQRVTYNRSSPLIEYYQEGVKIHTLRAEATFSRYELACEE